MTDPVRGGGAARWIHASPGHPVRCSGGDAGLRLRLHRLPPRRQSLRWVRCRSFARSFTISALCGHSGPTQLVKSYKQQDCSKTISVNLSIYHPSIHLFIHTSIYSSIHPSIYSSIHLPTSRTTYQPNQLPTYIPT